MATRIGFNIVFLLTLGLAVVSGASRPDFTGSWSLDKNRSFSNPAGLDQTMTVIHKGDEIRVEAKLITQQQGERLINEEFTLDGRERQFKPEGAAPTAKAIRKAYWLPGNRGFVVSDQMTTESADGKVVTQTTRKWTLSSDGATLTVDYYIDRPGISVEAKRVFTRAK